MKPDGHQEREIQRQEGFRQEEVKSQEEREAQVQEGVILSGFAGFLTGLVLAIV